VTRKLTVAVLALVVLATGFYGTWSYARNYYLYRGFPVIHDPPGIARGREVILKIWSKALHQQREVRVYLPPHYAQEARAGRRFPVLYLLQASVMQPTNYLKVGGLGPRVDTLVDSHRSPPYISVMPAGHGADHEWANAAAGNFDSYVMDVVHAIDRHFNTIPNRTGRIVAGLSEGGYGAINIALHHPREFSVVESWSGYQRPDKLRSIFGEHLGLLPANDPQTLVKREAPLLRRLHTYIWFYSGSTDPLHVENAAFARELTTLGIAHKYRLVYGGHNWALWRDNAKLAYRAASTRLAE
jgi:enterochelin esterase-like enzyme